MKNIILLGSTGSVGKNVLDVVRRNPGKFRIKAICSNSNVKMLAGQAREFSPEIVAVGDDRVFNELKKELPQGLTLLAGKDSIEHLAGDEDADILFMAISGTASLCPLVSALKAGRTVALASKEPIVSAGMIVNRIARDNLAKLLPVDSEHSAIMQCLGMRTEGEVRTLYITGSGGSLKDVPADEFADLPVERVLKHPTWDMGPKITVDSATLMNKGLEMIEARWLFNVPPEKIKIVIHPQSIIHSMVEFVDGTISAGLFSPDMRFPILRALAYPDIIESDFKRVDFAAIEKFTFSCPDKKKFPALDLAYGAISAGGTMPAVLNGANETAVMLFLSGKIRFTDIVRKVEDVMDRHKVVEEPVLEDIMDAQLWASEEVLRSC